MTYRQPSLHMIYKIGKGKSHIMTHCSDLVAEMVPITKVVSLYQVAILCGLDFRLNFVTFREKDLVSLVRSYRGLESPCDGFLWYCCNYSWSKPGKLGKLWEGGKPPNGRLLGVNGARENPERLSHLTHIPLCQAFTLSCNTQSSELLHNSGVISVNGGRGYPHNP